MRAQRFDLAGSQAAYEAVVLTRDRRDRLDVGLVPSEDSSGDSRSQGSITKTGNGHARRLLVEAAWHHAKPDRVPGTVIRDRWEHAPAAARLRGHDGNRPLHQRWQA